MRRLVLSARLTLAAIAVLPPGGCAGTGGGSAGHRHAEALARAQGLYDAGHYEEARTLADRIASQGHDDAQAAAYLAGLSAYRQDDLAAAESRLTRAYEGPDRGISAMAGASLGLVLLRDGRTERAARLLGDAATVLPPPDDREAAWHAAIAHRRLGDIGRAERWERIAGRTAVDAAEVPATPAIPAGSGRFVLQVGAWEGRESAEAAVRSIEPDLRGTGMGPARIVRIIGARGQSLYAVRFGDFATAAQADRVRRERGWLSYLVRAADR